MEKTLNKVLHKSIIFPFYLINEEDLNKVTVILVANLNKNKNVQKLFLHRLLMYFAQTKQALAATPSSNRMGIHLLVSFSNL